VGDEPSRWIMIKLLTELSGIISIATERGKEGEKAISMIQLEPGAGRAIKTFLAEQGCQGPIRIDLNSTGCCDVSLGLSVDQMRASDLIEEVDGLQFVMSPETYQLVGEVTISFVDEKAKRGFVLSSRKPVSEWDGFGVCTIRVFSAASRQTNE
jgi:Fe-S cluster assembly iron-binding protein IscA